MEAAIAECRAPDSHEVIDKCCYIRAEDLSLFRRVYCRELQLVPSLLIQKVGVSLLEAVLALPTHSNMP